MNHAISLRIICAVCCGCWLGPGLARAGEGDAMSLAGNWRFSADPADAGLAENWPSKALPGRIRLPGEMAAQGKGDPVDIQTPWMGDIVDRSFFTAPGFAPYRAPGNMKLPFWLTPERHYSGAAWYQRDIQIPARWKGKQTVLTLERPHWETRVWIDGAIAGTNDSLSTPHEYPLGALAPGRHTITVRVDNRLIVNLGANSHSVSDHTQGNWNGVAGAITLRAMPAVSIEDVQAWPDVARKSVAVTGRVTATGTNTARGMLSFELNGAPALKLPVDLTTNGGRFRHEIPLGPKAQLWDEFTPAVTQLTVKFGDAEARTCFGLREIHAEGAQFILNGRKAFFRGTLDCAAYPVTGHPPMDKATWVGILRNAKSYGLNLFRFHSWCPPEAAFAAADEVGFYFHIEAATWPNGSSSVGDGAPVDAWVHRETERILKAYGNHPSFLLMACGNEPGGRNQNRFLSDYVARFKKLDPRRLWTGGSGWPELAENQFHVLPDPRIQGWGEGVKSRINARPPETTTDYRDYISKRSAPVISHEIGQWCAYPDFDEIRQYTGPLKAKNFEIFRDSLAAHGMAGQARDFLLASGRLQALCYKEDIESALRTPGMGGFELLGLSDFPGQGTALVGVLNALWKNKGYISADEFRRFCGPVVPLARIPRRVFTTLERVEAEIEFAQFGPGTLSKATPYCRLEDESGRIVASQYFPRQDLPPGNGRKLGTAVFSLKDLPAPARYRLVAGLAGTEIRNDWNIWVYPPQAAASPGAGLTLVSEMNAEAFAALEGGGTVLWLLPPGSVHNDASAPVKWGFSSIFWNTAWTRRQAPTTLGILCDPKHPLFRSFPTGNFSDWQWWSLVRHSQPMILDGLPPQLRPLVQVIDDWTTNRRLGLVFEARAGRGRLCVCSVELEQGLENDPARRQFRASLINYLNGPEFRPKTVVSLSDLQKLKGPAGQ